jgi:hypothetical protein
MLPRTTPLNAVVSHTGEYLVTVNSVLESMWNKAVEPFVGIYRTLNYKTEENKENAVKTPCLQV